MNAQTDLSLRWAHRWLCWFCHAAAQMLSAHQSKQEIKWHTFLLRFLTDSSKHSSFSYSAFRHHTTTSFSKFGLRLAWNCSIPQCGKYAKASIIPDVIGWHGKVRERQKPILKKTNPKHFKFRTNSFLRVFFFFFFSRIFHSRQPQRCEKSVVSKDNPNLSLQGQIQDFWIGGSNLLRGGRSDHFSQLF